MNKIVVFDHQRDRRTERFAVSNARQYLDRVRLDLHPAAASIALLTPPEFMVDGSDIDIKSGG
jgi:hypothetical protein